MTTFAPGNLLSRTEYDNSSSTPSSVANYAYDGWKTGPDSAAAAGQSNWDVWADLGADTSTVAAHRVFGDGLNDVVARLTDAGGSTTAAWYLTDRQGSVAALTDSTGALADSVVYDGFANIVSESNSSAGDDYKYDGMRLDPAAGEYLDDARVFDPTTARFTSLDPTGFNAGDSNLYRYAGNSFANGTDPSGQVLLTWHHRRIPFCLETARSLSSYGKKSACPSRNQVYARSTSFAPLMVGSYGWSH